MGSLGWKGGSLPFPPSLCPGLHSSGRKTWAKKGGEAWLTEEETQGQTGRERKGRRMTETGGERGKVGRQDKVKRKKTHVRDGETKGERKPHHGERQETEMERE